jgi:hypothetical protein
MGRYRLCILLSLVLASQLGSTACITREQAQRRVVKGPTPEGVLLAPDLPSLKASIAAEGEVPGDVIRLPNGTKGRVIERKFLRGGILVDPYPANSYDMERDGAIEVELFEVTEGPSRGAKGWVRAAYLRPDFQYL